MRSCPPAIADFPSFEAELADALTRLDAHLAAHPQDERFGAVRKQLAEVKRFTAGGRCPTDAELGQTTFGAMAARELQDHPELADLLGRLSDYLHQWPRGVEAPSWP
jgi:hypothetical protein